mgnify:CR=1 FL=1
MANSPLDLLLARLESAGMKPRKSGRGWMARCPAHKDKSASLSVGEGRDGRALLRCFAGCELADVTAALADRYAALVKTVRKAIDETADAGDADQFRLAAGAGVALRSRARAIEGEVPGLPGPGVGAGTTALPGPTGS